LREHHGTADGESSIDRTNDLDHSHALPAKILELHGPSCGGADTAGIGEIAGPQEFRRIERSG